MICPRCGQDKERVVRVYRNMVYRDGVWRRANMDTREIICSECGARYFTETRLTHKIEFDNRLFKKVIVEI
ncbi:hypothetical protein Calab_1513 [Caldithrix abyssi DSM 13497]|uniref:Uncharacterized protein n=1 Tax=Caldithrix abyssi DSM 13497 TaxID=880073 RepID=H1XQI7_CALAY|nr:hypothetical protein [Caldithrix abyssi]APF16976.1 hypothetical protein Cabys_225 [Caldithrix abyssi DSM 13497]APF20335.1 hypothetical protein Cabys_3589 [Caldithrix abyssi DSM 13497]EHO40385.1 hypothetical protein Calab_0746 [Caldithrix abyssi DSM 13497]EHO41133.1 hypothetical protein Calab_1513 [Caldithrix abyssi DSM 13497]